MAAGGWIESLDSRPLRTAIRAAPNEEDVMAERIDVAEGRRKVAGGEALLVCAYEDESKCGRIKLEGAIFLAEFQRLAGSLPKDKEIIFYCA